MLPSFRPFDNFTCIHACTMYVLVHPFLLLNAVDIRHGGAVWRCECVCGREGRGALPAEGGATLHLTLSQQRCAGDNSQSTQKHEHLYTLSRVLECVFNAVVDTYVLHVHVVQSS